MDTCFGHFHKVIHTVQTDHQMELIANIIVIETCAIALVRGTAKRLPTDGCTVFTGIMGDRNRN